jgi:hypothetical protein
MVAKKKAAKFGVRRSEIAREIARYEAETKRASMAEHAPRVPVPKSMDEWVKECNALLGSNRELLAPWEICRAMVATTVEQYGAARTVAAVVLSVAASVGAAGKNVVVGLIMGRHGLEARNERGQG